MAKLTVKATLGTTTRRFPIADDVTFLGFQAQLKSFFGTTEPFAIKYPDPDSDAITVSTDVELSELFATVKQSSRPVVRVYLVADGKEDVAPAAPRSDYIVAAEKNISSFRVRPVDASQTLSSSGLKLADVPPLPSLVSGVSELITAIKTKGNADMDPTSLVAMHPEDTEISDACDVTVESVPRKKKKGKSMKGQNMKGKDASAPRRSALADLVPYMSAYPSGKAGLQKGLKPVSPEVKAAFKKLVRYISKSDNTSEIITALKDAFPIFREWIATELGDEGFPQVNKVDRLVAAGEASLLPKVGEKVAKRVMEFVGVALAEKPVLDVLRVVRGMGTMPWEDGYKPAVAVGKNAANSSDWKAIDAALSPARDPDSAGDVLMTEDVQGSRPQRKGIFAGLKPYMSAFPSGKDAFRKKLKSVSPEVKVAFKRLVRYVSKAGNSVQIIEALKDAFLVLRNWTVGGLADEGLPDSEKVEHLVVAGEAALLPKAGEEAAKHVMEFVRVAVADAAIVDMLRQVSGIGPMPWEAGFQPAVKKVKKSQRSTEPETEGEKPSDPRDLGTTDGTAKADGAEGRAPPRKGIFAGLRPYMSSFPSGKPAFRKSIKSVSPECRDAFRELVRYISKSDNRSEVVDAVKEAFPILRRWVSDELAGEGLPDRESVNLVVSTVGAILLSKAGEEDTKRVTDFVRIALGDEGIVAILRKVRDMGPMPWEAGFTKPSVQHVNKGPRGFDVHNGTTCNSCKTSPIVGSRFKCANRKNFNLCSDCYSDDAVAKNDMQFDECKFVWESTLADAKVPPAPLKVGDKGPSVKFLHKVLTDLGLMNEGMYAKRMGYFGPNTQAAVLEFQRGQMSCGMCEDGVYDKATAERLADLCDRGAQIAGKSSVSGAPIAMQA